ncbi:MAG: alpha/beta hydrolase [Spirochaetales bacterium]|nr:alpha/beta hydrolase [Spirochaetales bacterium]
MIKIKIVFIFIMIIFGILYAYGQTYKEYKIISAWKESVEVYKSGKTFSLKAYIFSPSQLSQNEKRPALLFFHGGGWFEGNAQGFKRNCRSFAQKGWISITFDYRLSNFKDINPIHCVMDAKSAVRWVRLHSDRLHINPEKVVIAGQSAGGHLALCTGLISDFNDPEDDISISCIPDAIICYSACFDTKRDSWFYSILPKTTRIEKTSPYKNIKSNLPPVLIFHGQEDETVSYSQAVDFYNKMLEFDNQCILYPFESGGHNLWPSYHDKIRVVSEDFLIKAGFTID